MRLTLNLQAIEHDVDNPSRLLVTTVAHEIIHIGLYLLLGDPDSWHCLSAQPKSEWTDEEWKDICFPYSTWVRELVLALPPALGIIEADIDELP